jgi:multiple sugar transport system permease protein
MLLLQEGNNVTDSGWQEQFGGNRTEKVKRAFSGWLVILPAVILFAFFIWVPLLETIRLSLYSTQGINVLDYVGLDNFKAVLNDPDFIPAIKNTFLYTGWSLVIGFFIPIIIAMLLNEIVHFKGLFRIGTYLPNVVPGLATVMIWGFFFRPGDTGVLNILLQKTFHIGPQLWLTNPHLTIPLIVLTMTWKSAGSTALIYLAGLQGINPELYEAAAIDGAGIWNRIWHVTLPNIFNLGRTMLVLQIISVFQILYEPLVMTNGGPNDASISIMQLVYRYAFEKFDYSKASAVSLIIAVMLIILTGIYNKLVKHEDM